MENTLSIDVLIRVQDPKSAASIYVEQLGLAITDETPDLISLRGGNMNLFIERRPALRPVLEVMVDDVEGANRGLVKNDATCLGSGQYQAAGVACQWQEAEGTGRCGRGVWDVRRYRSRNPVSG